MPIENRILLNDINLESADSSFSYGNKKIGPGYYKKFDSSTTVAYVVESFVGTIKIQGTLELYPSDTDWVDITGTEIGGDSSSINNSSLVRVFNGNFIWLRAAYNLQNGTISKIQYYF